MNNLFSSSSFKRYADLKQHAQMDDIEAGDTTTHLMSKFFEEVENVKQDLAELDGLHHRLRELNEEAKVAYDANTVKTIRSGMDKDVEHVLRRAKAVKGKLEALDRSNVAHRSLPGCGPGSSSDRTRTSVVAGLGKKLKDLMDDFQSLRTKMSEEYKETVRRRYYTVTGHHPDEQTIETLISSGNSETLVQKAIEEQGRGQVTDTISEIQERHGAVKEMEESLLELHRVFMDMAALVEAQGQQLDNIESHIANASSFVRSGVHQLEDARTHQTNSRKWMCIAVAVVLVVVIVLISSLLISFTNK